MIDFVIGEQYENRIGPYKIVEINKFNKTMKVVYCDYTDDILDMEIQSRIINNKALMQHQTKTIKKKTPNQPTTTPSFFTTLGYLSKHGYISFCVPTKKLDYLLQWYLEETQEELKEKNICIIENKWEASYQIDFPPGENDMSQFDFLFPVYFQDSHCNGYLRRRISSKKFITLLFDYGFKAGVNHDIEKILKYIPDQYKQDFLNGLNIK